MPKIMINPDDFLQSGVYSIIPQTSQLLPDFLIIGIKDNGDDTKGITFQIELTSSDDGVGFELNNEGAMIIPGAEDYKLVTSEEDTIERFGKIITRAIPYMTTNKLQIIGIPFTERDMLRQFQGGSSESYIINLSNKKEKNVNIGLLQMLFTKPKKAKREVKFKITPYERLLNKITTTKGKLIFSAMRSNGLKWSEFLRLVTPTEWDKKCKRATKLLPFFSGWYSLTLGLPLMPMNVYTIGVRADNTRRFVLRGIPSNTYQEKPNIIFGVDNKWVTIKDGSERMREIMLLQSYDEQILLAHWLMWGVFTHLQLKTANFMLPPIDYILGKLGYNSQSENSERLILDKVIFMNNKLKEAQAEWYSVLRGSETSFGTGELRLMRTASGHLRLVDENGNVVTDDILSTNNVTPDDHPVINTDVDNLARVIGAVKYLMGRHARMVSPVLSSNTMLNTSFLEFLLSRVNSILTSKETVNFQIIT